MTTRRTVLTTIGAALSGLVAGIIGHRSKDPLQGIQAPLKAFGNKIEWKTGQLGYGKPVPSVFGVPGAKKVVLLGVVLENDGDMSIGGQDAEGWTTIRIRSKHIYESTACIPTVAPSKQLVDSYTAAAFIAMKEAIVDRVGV